jgi:hypothetical protein
LHTILSSDIARPLNFLTILHFLAIACVSKIPLFSPTDTAGRADRPCLYLSSNYRAAEVPCLSPYITPQKAPAYDFDTLDHRLDYRRSRPPRSCRPHRLSALTLTPNRNSRPPR